ncbi:MAG: shikimate kinase [Acutalibacteraceae bacterium]|nr:shikimate kinase [Acutalibacteraceae bacterium]
MKYGLIGEKLGHSFSKEVHNKLFDYDYELKEIPQNELDLFLKQRAFKAINVTIPYKEKVIPYLDFISDIAKEIGAVNTVVNKNGKLYGYNTDFWGLKSLIQKSGISLNNKKVLILGSGGTSKTAFAVANSLGAKEVLQISRNKKDGFITYEDIYINHTDAQILINTTPCGMYPNIDVSPLDISAFKRLEGVVDAIYNPLRSKLVCDAQKRGIKAVGGLYMLISQAVFAAEKFLDTNIEPQKTDAVYKSILNQKQNIVLVGMPGSGKTTVGKLLAKKLQLEFLDTDNLITEKYGNITDIFKTKGEAVFRDYESEVIKEISAVAGRVIATGGGAVLRAQNTDLLKRNGRIYFLDRPLESICATPDRPLSSNREDLEKRFNERYDIYRNCADRHIISNGTETDTVNAVLEDILK